MVIKRVYNDNTEDYEVGKNGVESIELTNHGNEKQPIYLLEFSNRENLYLGLLEHNVEYFERIEEQTTIFDYL